VGDKHSQKDLKRGVQLLNQGKRKVHNCTKFVKRRMGGKKNNNTKKGIKRGKEDHPFFLNNLAV
jgi:hypothetical protein